MKILLAQQNFHVGNFTENTAKIIEAIREGKKKGAELVVFPELSVCGYPPQDFLEFNDFLRNCYESINRIAAECKGIAAIVGAPAPNDNPLGKNLFNAAYFLQDGKVSSIHHKALLPNYDVFDEYRYFEPAKSFHTVTYKNVKLAITVCEDIWDIDEDPMYTISPLDELSKEKPDVIINISASPFHYQQAELRKKVLTTNAKKYSLPLIYVNQVGAQTELIFDGGSAVMDAKGNTCEQLSYFESELRLIDTSKLNPIATTKQPEKAELIYHALVLGIKDYFKKLHFSQAVLGLSGGIDSAVTLVLAVRALGKENVKAVLLPSEFSSDHSIADAVKLAKTLGCAYEIIPIKNTFNSLLQTLEIQFRDYDFNLAEENMQARIRGIILMALSNKMGYILLNTSNKSEAAVGYGTLYGDMCGGISVLGDVYKTEVYELANLINRTKEVIPMNSITKPPSAELRPNQKDSDSLPEYEILDQILYQYIEKKLGPTEIKAKGFDAALVDRILKLVNINEHKRHQTPPILRVSPKAFGMGRRMPIVGKYLS